MKQPAYRAELIGVAVALLIFILTASGTAIYKEARTETRVEALEKDQDKLEKKQQQDKADYREDLKEINKKLDVLLEKAIRLEEK